MSRKVINEPNFSEVSSPTELQRIEKEIIKFLPKVEVTIEGSGEMATGQIVEWYAKRYFFTVKWKNISPEFVRQTDSSSELRVYFKTQLFSTQILFKTNTLRRLSKAETPDGSIMYHYRIPDQIFQQQQRGALRVPLSKKAAALGTPLGKFEIIDLSASGAKFKNSEMTTGLKIEPLVGHVIQNCELFFAGKSVSATDIQVTVARVHAEWVAVKFSRISDLEVSKLKLFLIEALRAFYADETRS